MLSAMSVEQGLPGCPRGALAPGGQPGAEGGFAGLDAVPWQPCPRRRRRLRRTADAVGKAVPPKFNTSWPISGHSGVPGAGRTVLNQ